MGWAVGDHNGRDIGYGVPAKCDHPDCDNDIDRGLAYVCGGAPYGGDDGCGLFFCATHGGGTLCERCEPEAGADPLPPFPPKPDVPVWINHKLTDPSWQQWRDENPDEVKALKGQCG